MGSGLGFSLVVWGFRVVILDQFKDILGCLWRCCWIISEVCWVGMGSGLGFSLVVANMQKTL